MSNEDFNELLSLDCEERYDYSLDVIVEEKEIWILVNDNDQFLKIYSEDEGFEYLPIWPSSELALNYGQDANDLKPKSISLPEFLKKWVPGLQGDDLEVGVFPGADTSVWITSATEFKDDLQAELSNF